MKYLTTIAAVVVGAVASTTSFTTAYETDFWNSLDKFEVDSELDTNSKQLRQLSHASFDFSFSFGSWGEWEWSYNDFFDDGVVEEEDDGVVEEEDDGVVEEEDDGVVEEEVVTITVYKIEATMSMTGYTVDSFDDTAQTAFKSTIATLGGIDVEKIEITSVTASGASSSSMVVLDAAGIDIEYVIASEDESEINTVHATVTDEDTFSAVTFSEAFEEAVVEEGGTVPEAFAVEEVVFEAPVSEEVVVEEEEEEEEESDDEEEEEESDDVDATSAASNNVQFFSAVVLVTLSAISFF